MRRVKRVAASVRAASEAASATAILSRGRPITGSGRPQVNQFARRDDEDDDDGGGNVQPSRRDVYVRRCDGQKGRWMSGPPEDVASDQVTIALANAGKSRREASNVGMNRSNGLEACQAAGPDMSSVQKCLQVGRTLAVDDYKLQYTIATPPMATSQACRSDSTGRLLDCVDLRKPATAGGQRADPPHLVLACRPRTETVASCCLVLAALRFQQLVHSQITFVRRAVAPSTEHLSLRRSHPGTPWCAACHLLRRRRGKQSLARCQAAPLAARVMARAGREPYMRVCIDGLTAQHREPETSASAACEYCGLTARTRVRPHGRTGSVSAVVNGAMAPSQHAAGHHAGVCGWFEGARKPQPVSARREPVLPVPLQGSSGGVGSRGPPGG
ncbi:hypothetical protein Purlil1_6549 [Purpureocillium lilacinum]|uniref:Uncharacterized protein n=1 Tax=Purpureocillium lilacinum TaxID=33203 RepID=A0ABR0BZB0_PURLI|nr:hypothetical protein Purlil1_6549 [Purpureocillium lilacinum]